MAKCDQKFIDRCKAKKGANAYVFYNETKDMCMCGTKKMKKTKGGVSVEKHYDVKGREIE
jgi:hypothetical protein